jgi:hypothetical protein
LGCKFEQFKPAPGFVWAARRELLEEFSLYDACVVGGGDGVITRAAYGCFTEAIEYQSMSDQFSRHYMAWANRFYDAVRGRIGLMEDNLLHLWHGKMENRQYAERINGILGFDPFGDIALDDNGTWRWNSNKRDMQEFVRQYFVSRREDG